MRRYNHRISKKANDSLNRRATVVRSQRCALAVVIILVVSLGILLSSVMNAFASAEGDVASYNKYYKSVRVDAGDTLWTIADEYIDGLNIDKKDYIKEICQLNSITEDDIHAGDYIVVAYYSQEIK